MARESRRGANTRVRIGICLNEECELANSKAKQSIRSGHDFVCERCGSELRECPPEKKKNMLPLIVAVAVIVLGVAGFFIWQQGKDSKAAVEKIETVDTTLVTPPVAEPVDTLKKEAESDGTIVEVEPSKPLDPNAVVTLDLGYAVYKGKVKNGKMHDDNGVLTFKQKHIIESRDVKKRQAEIGERVIGIFEDGHLTTGTWHKKDGNKETIIP
jgi:hypothetical protein